MLRRATFLLIGGLDNFSDCADIYHLLGKGAEDVGISGQSSFMQVSL
jgi:hypothetical protein